MISEEEFEDIEFNWEYIGKFWVDFIYCTDFDCAGFNNDWVVIEDIRYNSELTLTYPEEVIQLKLELLEYARESKQGIDYSGRDWSKQADNE